MSTLPWNPEQHATLLLVILGASVVLQAGAAWIALSQIKIVMGRYRLDLHCHGLGLDGGAAPGPTVAPN